MIVIVLLIDPSIAKLAIAKLDHSLSFSELIKISVVAFFIPALTEEIVFRGLLLPKRSPIWIARSLLAYVLWHPLEAVTFLPASAPYFLELQFLWLVAILGLFCTAAYIRTGSLWASVLVHWLVVVAWKATGGARFLA